MKICRSCCGVQVCCTHPLDPVLPLYDSQYGITTNLVWNGSLGSAHWIGCSTIPYPGSGSCPSASVTVQYDFTCSGTSGIPGLVIIWQGSGSCPVSGGTCGVGNNNLIVPFGPEGFVKSWHCPSPPSTKYQAIFHMTGLLWPGAGGSDLTVG